MRRLGIALLLLVLLVLGGVFVYKLAIPTAEKKPCFAALPWGDFYGSFEPFVALNMLDRATTDSLIKLPFSAAVLRDILPGFKRNGVDTSRVYLVLNSSLATFHVVLYVEDSTRAQEFWATPPALFEDTTLAVSKLNFTCDSDWLKITWTDSTLLRLFPATKKGVAGPVDSLFLAEPNQFCYKSNLLDSIGLEQIVLIPSQQTYGLTMQVKSKLPFPFRLKDSLFSAPTLGDPTRQMALNLEWDTLNTHPLAIRLNAYLNLFGQNLSKLVRDWDGTLVAENGPDKEEVDTIVTTDFDDDFNPIEKRTIRRKMQPTYLLYLGSSNSSSLVGALNDNRFFYTRKNTTRLPNGQLAQTNYAFGGVLFASPNSQIDSLTVTNQLRSQWNDWLFRLDAKQPMANELDINLSLQPFKNDTNDETH